MGTKLSEKKIRAGVMRAFWIGVVGMLAAAMTLVPLPAAGAVREEDRITNDRNINRSEVENLQRWVSSGHADWCKDARLVAAEELWRRAVAICGAGLELNATTGEACSDGRNRARIS